MGRRGADYSRRQGARTARNLKRVGVNVDLAPVLDVGRPGSAIRAQHRSFGGKPRRVIRTAIPFANAIEQPGRRGDRQALPGPGGGAREHRPRRPADPPEAEAAAADRRAALPRLRRRRRRPGDDLDRDLHALLAQAGGLLEEDRDRRASRHRLGFRGVSISDALETVSARHFGGPAKVGVAAAKAGTDLLLFTDHRRRRSGGAGAEAQAALGQAGARGVRGLRPARARPAGRTPLGLGSPEPRSGRNKLARSVLRSQGCGGKGRA